MSTVWSIQLSSHQRIFAGTNEGCTNPRYLRCSVPPIMSRLLSWPIGASGLSTACGEEANTVSLRYASSHAA